jgi:hypothetical protein
VHLDAEVAHPLRDHSRRAVLFESDLGMGVKVSPQSSQPFVVRKDGGQWATQGKS